jgi:uncharacterized membrane protein YkvA (DUF1232 family)
VPSDFSALSGEFDSVREAVGAKACPLRGVALQPWPFGLPPAQATLARVNLTWSLVGVGAFLLFYSALVLALVIAGRRESARALAGFIPDCIVLCGRLLRDPRVPRRKKALLVALAGYLALRFDLVPDFIPVAGQLDDVVIVALVLRSLLRGDGKPLVREHWPGPDASLALVLRLAA